MILPIADNLLKYCVASHGYSFFTYSVNSELLIIIPAINLCPLYHRNFMCVIFLNL